MAQNTVILRPNADVSLGHKVYPDTLLQGWQAISEETADNDATYIVNDRIAGTSVFNIPCELQPQDIPAISVHLTIYCPKNFSASVEKSVTATLYCVDSAGNETEILYGSWLSTGSANWTQVQFHADANDLQTLRSLDELSSFHLKIYTSHDSGGSIDVSQAYIAINLDNTITYFEKENGEWVERTGELYVKTAKHGWVAANPATFDSGSLYLKKVDENEYKTTKAIAGIAVAGLTIAGRI